MPAPGEIANLTYNSTALAQRVLVVDSTGAASATSVKGGSSEVSFTTTTAAAVASTDASAYRWVSVQITSQGGSSSVAFQGSNDNTNWVSVGLNTATVSGTGGVLGNIYTSTTSTGVFYGPVNYRYFRLNVTGIASGTTAGVVEFLATAGTPLVPTIASVQNGTWTAVLNPATSGGLSTYHLVSAASANATNVKNSAGQLYGIQVTNTNAAARKLAFHNTSGTPTAGASVFFSVVVPASGNISVAYDNGITFSSGIGITTVTGTADSDSTGVGANDLNINLFYK